MKTLIIFTLLISSTAFSKVCTVDSKPGGANPNDCIHCSSEMRTPVGKAGNAFDGVVNFVTNKDEQKKAIDQFKGRLNFLNSKKNQAECSNYKTELQKYKSEFQKELGECEEGPDMLDRRKIICDYVLNTYSNSIIDTFYDHWSRPGPDGKPVLIPGRTLEQIEGPIRAHHSWCKKVTATYKNKMFISCGSVADWVQEFDTAKRISDSMKRDMASSSSTSAEDTRNARKKVFDEACKYFDTHPANTYTRDLYLECVTR